MANQFLPIDQFTLKSTLTGTEEFQVSATEKVTAQQIADLASSGLNVYTISESESQNQKIDASRVEELKKSELVLFPNEGSYTPYFKVSVDDSKAYFITGNIPINSQGQPGLNNGEEPPFEQIQTVMIEVDLTTYDITIQPYPVIKKSWFKGDVSVIEITDFAIPSVNITKDGQSFLFYANDASNIPNSNHGATSFVGVAIASPIFITGDQRFLYYMMVDTARGMFYTGRANLGDDVVAWNDTPVTRLGQAVQVTAFTEGALSSLLYTFKAGDFIPFYTGNVTASTANQFPESGVFNGFISMGSNEGDYFQIFAFKTGSPNAYIGACIGSTTRWTQIGGGSSNLIVVADAENVGEVVAAYKGFEGSNKYGVSVPIYIEAMSNIYDELPAIMDQSFTKDESTICGYAQYVYDGGDYYHIGLSLLIYPSSGDRPKYRAELVVNNSGEVVSSNLTPIGSAHAPIPGFTKITSLAGQTDYSLTKGSMGVINFSTEVNANTIMFIEAEVRSSAAISADVRSVCIPVSFFNPKKGATLMDLNTRTLASGTNIAQVKLNVASVVTGANGVQGLNCVVTSNNLANPSDILRIKAVYANI
jgi:hypothetical protein|nr:MAG TPA: hypothetical protein [Crassvirales sp.]